MISFDLLRARFAADRHAGGAAPALADALERIGWRAVQDPPADELASYLVELVDACVHDHHDTELLGHAIATLLRDSGPLLDGGLPPVEAYRPAADELLRHYLDPVPNAGLDPRRFMEAL